MVFRGYETSHEKIVYLKTIDGQTFLSLRKQYIINRKAIPEKLLFLVIAVLGLVYILYTWKNIEREQSENVLQIARSVETLFPAKDLSALEAQPTDIIKPQYEVIKNILKEVIRVNHRARFAYIYIHRNGKLYFIADSEPADSKDCSPPGQEYTEAAVDYYQPFYNGRELVTGSATDRWGTWRSVLIPMKDKVTGKTFAVFAMDFNAKFWNTSVLTELLQSSIIILLMLITFLFFFKIRSRNRSLRNEITGRRQVQEKLQESEEKYRLIFENTPVGLLSFDEHGVIVACNENFTKIIGSSREVLIGLNMLNLPDKKLVSIVKDALNGKTGLYEDFYHTVTSNRISPVRVLFAPILVGNGQIHGGVGIIEDVTERLKAEAEVSQSKERARRQRSVIARIAEDEVISFGDLADSFKRLTEAISEAILVERVSIWLLSEDKAELKCISLFENSIKKHSSGVILKYAEYPRYFQAINLETRINVHDAQNDPRTSEFTVNYLCPLGITSMLDACIYEEGHLKGVICFEHTGEKRTWYSDEESFASTMASIIAQTLANNKRKLAEMEMKRKNEELLTLNAEKDKFFSIIAHDLRSPFNSFLGFTGILVEELPDLSMDELKKIAVNMRASATNLYRLLENLLEWSVLQRGITTFNKESFLLNKMITDCIALVLDAARKKDIEICFDIPGNIMVVGDVHMLGTVIRNLVSNAVKFTPRGGKVTLAVKSIPGDQVEISVKDSGIGMSREIVEKLFRHDVQTTREGTEREPSTGLGLIICKGFIEKHGGNLWVESEEGKGSRFYFTLPYPESGSHLN
jgi:PAS domain S-box-containing protein